MQYSTIFSRLARVSIVLSCQSRCCLTKKPLVHEHLLKMSFPAVRDPACRTIEVWPGWATYLRYSKSLKLNKLGSKLWAAIVSGDDAERELLEDKFFAMLMEYCEYLR